MGPGTAAKFVTDVELKTPPSEISKAVKTTVEEKVEGENVPVSVSNSVALGLKIPKITGLLGGPPDPKTVV